MNTPIFDFVSRYERDNISRLHMPGHKGRGPMGFEQNDITEVTGADALYEADGIIAESERNASSLFGSGMSLYSCEGSSQCIRAMIYLAVTRRDSSAAPVILAGRNAHKAFLYALALVGADVEWLYPEAQVNSPCACPLSAEGLKHRLSTMGVRPCAVYVTSPDYLGGMLDIAAISEICHRHGIPLLVDNAHGAYLKFLSPSKHPMDLNADLCCDSAHKTLPVLTGGAYLHISSAVMKKYAASARQAMALFGSTSPSYLILQSLDLCNLRLSAGWPDALHRTASNVASLKEELAGINLRVAASEPMKIVLECDGDAAHRILRAHGVECEYHDPGHLVMMFSPDNTQIDYLRIRKALSAAIPEARKMPPLPSGLPRRMSVRNAIFSKNETVPLQYCSGRICASPTVSCPPAVPIVVSGEEITAEAQDVMRAYGIQSVCVVSPD